MSRKYHIRERSFLNLHTDMRAYVIGIVEDTRDNNHCCASHEESGEITLEIADCTSSIELHFDLKTAPERENSLHKIRKLAEVIAAVRDAIEIECKTIDERQAVRQHTRAASSVH